MKTKGNVKTYELNNHGHYVLVEANERLNDNEHSSSYNEEVLYSNPFLFNIEKSNGFYVSSIEDFYLKDKDRTYNMGELLRNINVKKCARNKIVKKNFKNWKKEIDERIKFVFTNAKYKLQEANSSDVINVSFGNKILLFISCAIAFLLLFNVIKIIPPLSGYKRMIAFSVIVLSFLGLILSIVQGVKSHQYLNQIVNYKKSIKKYEKEINKSYLKKFKKTYKYYKKGLKKRVFTNPPLTMDKIVIGGDKIDYIEKSTIKINEKYMRNIVKKEGFLFTYHLPIFLSYVVIIISGGYLIVELIIYIINYIAKGE